MSVNVEMVQYVKEPNGRNRVTLLQAADRVVSKVVKKLSSTVIKRPRSIKGRCTEDCEPCARNQFNVTAWEVSVLKEDDVIKGIKVIIHGLDSKRTGLEVSAERFSIKRPPFVVHLEKILDSEMALGHPFWVEVELHSDLYTPPPTM